MKLWENSLWLPLGTCCLGLEAFTLLYLGLQLYSAPSTVFAASFHPDVHVELLRLLSTPMLQESILPLIAGCHILAGGLLIVVLVSAEESRLLARCIVVLSAYRWLSFLHQASLVWLHGGAPPWMPPYAHSTYGISRKLLVSFIGGVVFTFIAVVGLCETARQAEPLEDEMQFEG